MALMNLCAGRGWRRRHREPSPLLQERVGRLQKAASPWVHSRVSDRQLARSCCVTHGGQPGALRGPRGVAQGKGGRLPREVIYV